MIDEFKLFISNPIEMTEKYWDTYNIYQFGMTLWHDIFIRFQKLFQQLTPGTDAAFWNIIKFMIAFIPNDRANITDLIEDYEIFLETFVNT